MIEFNEVSKRFGSRHVLDKLSFSAPPGKITGLLGRNGAGKTTALRILVGLDSPSHGFASIGGQSFSKLKPGLVGVGLSPAFPPTRTVIQQISVSALALGATKSDVQATLAETQLENVANKRCFSLSLGMKQRLLLACATVAKPNVLILDEPVNGLDPDGISWLHGYLKSFANSGSTVLVSSHYLNDLQTYADQIVIIQGKTLWAGVWPNESEPSLSDLFARTTANLEIE
ncbi:MAG: ATP-binding cassette domain-containing protein [Rhodoluna sp.]